jgi:hypothetical protein
MKSSFRVRRNRESRTGIVVVVAKRNCYLWDRSEAVVYLCIVGTERIVIG